MVLQFKLLFLISILTIYNYDDDACVVTACLLKYMFILLTNHQLKDIGILILFILPFEIIFEHIKNAYTKHFVNWYLYSF